MSDQLTQHDCMKVLDEVFKSNTRQKNIEEALKFIEDNFTKQQNLVPILVDYYINFDCNKQLIELLCKIPDDLVNRVLDKLNDHLKVSSAKLDKIMSLLVAFAYNSKFKLKWCLKFIQHALFSLLLRSLNAKSTTPNATNELMSTQSCLLFVLLMNTIQSQIVNHLQDMFQIVFNSFKSITSNEQQQQQHLRSPHAHRTVKWSMKLFFYVFYGLFPHQFFQYLRKKENQTINKDILTSILFYLRVHPSLLKEKVDMPPTKPTSDDTIFEWRQYCLDQTYTNLNQIVNDALQTTFNSNVYHQQLNIIQQQTSIITSSERDSSLFGSNLSLRAPLSPTQQSSLPNVTKSINETTSDRQRHFSSASTFSTNARNQISLQQIASTKLTSQQNNSIVPLTPLVLSTSEIGQNRANQHQIFQFPLIEPLENTLIQTQVNNTTNQLDSMNSLIDNAVESQNEQQQQGAELSLNYAYLRFPNSEKPIKNLTAQFMSPDEQQQQIQPQFKIKKKTIQPLNENICQKIERKQLKNTSNASQNARFSFIGPDNLAIDNREGNFNSMNEKTKERLLLFKQKSLSESNLAAVSNDFYERRPKTKTVIGDPMDNNEREAQQESEISRVDESQHAKNQNQQQQQQLQQKIQQQEHHQQHQQITRPKKLIKSEMRDSNIIRDPTLFFNQATTPSSDSYSRYFNSLISTSNASEAYQHGLDSINAKRQFESNDILNSYLLSNDCSEAILRREYENLRHELMFERYLREKYEEVANRLYHSKIECDQLNNERNHLEKCLKDTIEKHKKELKDFYNTTNVELKTLQKDIEEKNKELENSKHRETDLDAKLRALEEKFEEYKNNFKKLEKKYETTEQALEKEQNYNKHYQNEANYIRALRNTTDNLRKKLLLMTKIYAANVNSNNSSNSNSVNNSNATTNGTTNTNQLFNNKNSTNDLYEYLFEKETQLNSYLNPLYKDVIDSLNQKLVNLQVDYNELLRKHNEKKEANDRLNAELDAKKREIEELKEQLCNSMVEMNRELIKSHNNVYQSSLNINKRLENEIIKLKSELCSTRKQLELKSQQVTAN